MSKKSREECFSQSSFESSATEKTAKETEDSLLNLAPEDCRPG